VLLGVLGCSSGHGASAVTVDVSGTQGQPIPVTDALDILVVPISVNGVAGNAVVDTGSPIVALDPSAFPRADLPTGSGALSSLSVGSLTIAGLSVVGANLVTSPDPTIPIDGSLGCGFLCAFVVSLDYRGATLTLGPSPTPANVASPGAVSFSLAGGATTMVDGVPGNVVFPASRIPVAVTLEGQPHTFILDTGSSLVLIRQAIFTSLVADGRAQIGGLQTATIGQPSSSSVTRVHSLVVAGQEVDGLVVSADPSLEAGLDSLASETNLTVDGLIGGSYLRQFYVTVDYPGGSLELRRYTKGAPTFDLFDRIGVDVSPTGGVSATVTKVFPGTNAAAMGVAEGDAIVAVDGEPLAHDGAVAVDTAVSGTVGSVKSVQFGAASSAALSEKTVEIVVDDILPL
jgi:hypothetical protein